MFVLKSFNNSSGILNDLVHFADYDQNNERPHKCFTFDMYVSGFINKFEKLCTLKKEINSSWLPLPRTFLIMTEVLVLLHWYCFVIFESGNIMGNSSLLWSAKRNGRLCSAVNAAYLTAADMTKLSIFSCTEIWDNSVTERIPYYLSYLIRVLNVFSHFYVVAHRQPSSRQSKYQHYINYSERS